MSININAMSIAWYVPAVAYEALAGGGGSGGGGMLGSVALRDPWFWGFQAL
jgi:hypothetical protein